jgi:hypothetical protein
MPKQRPNKNEGVNALLGEAQAALWLSESLILALLEADLLDADTILEAIDIVIAAKKTKIAEGGECEQARAAITQLASISASIAAAKASRDTNKTIPADRVRQKRST